MAELSWVRLNAHSLQNGAQCNRHHAQISQIDAGDMNVLIAITRFIAHSAGIDAETPQ
jgi:hypothetical protein